MYFLGAAVERDGILYKRDLAGNEGLIVRRRVPGKDLRGLGVLVQFTHERDGLDDLRRVENDLPALILDRAPKRPDDAAGKILRVDVGRQAAAAGCAVLVVDRGRAGQQIPVALGTARITRFFPERHAVIIGIRDPAVTEPVPFLIDRQIARVRSDAGLGSERLTSGVVYVVERLQPLNKG